MHQNYEVGIWKHMLFVMVILVSRSLNETFSNPTMSKRGVGSNKEILWQRKKLLTFYLRNPTNHLGNIAYNNHSIITRQES